MAVSGQRRRQGRQEAQAGYGAPQAQYGQPQADASSLSESHSGDHQGLDWLLESVPGTPGEDYPILAEVPETAFSCDGQVEGGTVDERCSHFCRVKWNDRISALERFSEYF